MEGITGYLYRNAWDDFFGGAVEKFFTPFLAVNQNGITKARELADISPKHNAGKRVIPQLLGNHCEQIKSYVNQLEKLGYREINLNLGCPYQTVVSKGKGAGLLADMEFLKRFLDGVFTIESVRDGSVKLSVKTRIGVEQPEEWGQILEVYNQFPLSELILHPRVRAAFYEGAIHLECYALALAESKAPVCYNGDLFSKEAYQGLVQQFPQTQCCMLGRGLLANPGLLRQLTGGEGLKRQELKAFHDRIYGDYRRIMSGDTNALFKMKELWNYQQFLFADCKKQMKKIRKAQRGTDYEEAVEELFRDCRFLPEAGFFVNAC